MVALSRPPGSALTRLVGLDSITGLGAYQSKEIHLTFSPLRQGFFFLQILVFLRFIPIRRDSDSPAIPKSAAK
jgi:hypothetical protein